MKKRVLGLDIIRALAVFLVIYIHYFSYNNFFYIKMTGSAMFLANFIRWFTYSCVPLFMILTGYLMRKKEVSKEYYKGIFRVVTMYLISSVIISIYLYLSKTSDQNIFSYIMNIFSFSYYGWYIEMYIGLYLVIPFLNILYNNIPKKSHKQLLIIILLSVISLSPMFNNIKVGEKFLTFMIDYWYISYPLIYYFIGAYINEYKPKINTYVNLGIIFFLLYLESLTTYFYYYGKNYDSSIFFGYGALPTIIISTLMFILLYDKNIKNKLISSLIHSVAKVSLSIYLLSYIFDRFFYRLLQQKYGPFMNGTNLLKYMVPMVIIIFISSYILALIVEGIVNYIKIKFKNKKEGNYEIN